MGAQGLASSGLLGQACSHVRRVEDAASHLPGGRGTTHRAGRRRTSCNPAHCGTSAAVEPDAGRRSYQRSGVRTEARGTPKPPSQLEAESSGTPWELPPDALMVRGRSRGLKRGLRLRLQNLLLGQHLVEVELRAVAAEQLARAVKPRTLRGGWHAGQAGLRRPGPEGRQATPELTRPESSRRRTSTR